MTLFTASAMTLVLIATSTTAGKSATVQKNETSAYYLAEGGIEVAKKALIRAVADFDPVPTTGSTTIGISTVDYSVEPTGFSDMVVDESGIQTIVTGYRIEASAGSGRSRTTSRRIVNVAATPIFQFAVFYSEDLEIFPGPSMTLGGRVHTNGDMYIGSGGTLTVDTNYCRAIGGIYRNRKDDASASPGTVKVRRWVADPYDPAEPAEYVDMNSRSQMDALGVANKSGYDSAFLDGWDDNGDGDFYDADDWLPWGAGAEELWSEPGGYLGGTGSTVQSAAHGTTEAVPPSIGSIAMFDEVDGGVGGDYVWSDVDEEYLAVAPGTGTHDKGYFHENSDLSIVMFEDGTWEAFDGDGFDVTASLSGVVTITDILDTRQSSGTNTAIDVMEIDIDALNNSGVFPENGLLYAAAYGADEATDAKGVVLTNGVELKGPLSVVTENSVYVQGDYNTTGKVGASVIADAVNLLSNAWDGSKDANNSLPTASETTYNLAFITGNQETVGSSYNGGLENLPRFHENWSGINCNLNGSFVNTWASSSATGKWVYGGNRYEAPNRQFTYDTDFNDTNNLPPFTPMAVTANEVVAW